VKGFARELSWKHARRVRDPYLLLIRIGEERYPKPEVQFGNDLAGSGGLETIGYFLFRVVNIAQFTVVKGEAGPSFLGTEIFAKAVSYTHLLASRRSTRR